MRTHDSGKARLLTDGGVVARGRTSETTGLAMGLATGETTSETTGETR